FDGDAFFYFAHRLSEHSSLKDTLFSMDAAHQYRPLGLILFSYVLHPLFGLSMMPYNLTALFFHICNTILVYFILRRLLKTQLSIFAGTFFWGINPVAIYVTHSISFLADFSYAFFYFAALLLFLKFVETPKTRLAVGSIVCFVLSLL